MRALLFLTLTGCLVRSSPDPVYYRAAPQPARPVRVYESRPAPAPVIVRENDHELRREEHLEEKAIRKEDKAEEKAIRKEEKAEKKEEKAEEKARKKEHKGH